MNTIKLDSLIPYLRVKNAAAAIDFYTKAFDAKELVRITDPEGLVAHAELALGTLRLKLADEMHDQLLIDTQTHTKNPIVLDLIVSDVDAQVKKAELAGATLLRPLSNKFYGYRDASLQDPFGHVWIIGMKLEDVSPNEMQERANELYRNA